MTTYELQATHYAGVVDSCSFFAKILGEKMHDAKGESYACCNH